MNALVAYCLLARHERSERGLALGGIHAPDGHLIHAELPRGFREDRLHDRDSLHSARRTLRSARGRVRQDRHSAPAHRLRLVKNGDDSARRECIAHHVVRAVVADHVHIEGRDPAFLGESDLHAAVQTGARAADGILLFASDAHHDRSAGLFRQERGDHEGDIAGNLAAKSSACILTDKYDVADVDAQPPRDRRDGLRRALRAGVNVDLAVLPVRHRACESPGTGGWCWA